MSHCMCKARVVLKVHTLFEHNRGISGMMKLLFDKDQGHHMDVKKFQLFLSQVCCMSVTCPWVASGAPSKSTTMSIMAGTQ